MTARLNKTRIRDTKIVIIATFVIIILIKQFIGHDDLEIHESIEFGGYFLVSLCAVGRVYCTAFLGGFKNQEIIDYGPFSVCRNPLYLFSFIGILGISLITAHVIVMLVTPLSFLLIYLALIKREEVYLQDKFGAAYTAYKAKTPRLIPNFKLYHAPKKVEMAPKNMLSAMGDSLLWFLAFPLIELVEYLQNAGYIQPLFHIRLGL
jgi:protein-S-isoprenylcysteine O-methyltransferase Ste14